MAGEGDILGGTASGAAAGSMFGPWGTAIGAGVGLAGGIFKYLGSQAQADAMREQAAEALRRKKAQDAQMLGQATAAGAASGVEFDSSSLQGYLGTMRNEMKRQQDWMEASGSTNADNVSLAGTFGLFTDVGGSLSSLAKDSNYWRGG